MEFLNVGPLYTLAFKDHINSSNPIFDQDFSFSAFIPDFDQLIVWLFPSKKSFMLASNLPTFKKLKPIFISYSPAQPRKTKEEETLRHLPKN